MGGLRPFSDHRRGLFISIDGPSGAGKSTIVAHLANLLIADGEQVHVTAEPSEGVIGKLARQVTETVTGPALACLYAADRYHHIETEIRPRTKAGEIVITDRYVPSGLVIQRFDGVDPAFLWALNAGCDRPDLAVVLEADAETIARRLHQRGPHNRFQSRPGSSHAEVHFYRQAIDRLIQAGYDVLRIPTSTKTPDQIATAIHNPTADLLRHQRPHRRTHPEGPMKAPSLRTHATAIRYSPAAANSRIHIRSNPRMR